MYHLCERSGLEIVKGRRRSRRRSRTGRLTWARAVERGGARTGPLAEIICERRRSGRFDRSRVRTGLSRSAPVGLAQRAGGGISSCACRGGGAFMSGAAIVDAGAISGFLVRMAGGGAAER